jgi:hypothetical protein
MDGAAGRPGTGSTGTQPPASAIGYSGDILVGTPFTVTAGGCWFEGYWDYVATGSSTAPRKYALWTYNGPNPATGQHVFTDSVVMSGELSPGWNFTAAPSPIPLGIGTPYLAAAGVNGPFLDTTSQFNAGDPYSGGITNGPLRIYSGPTGSYPAPGNMAQGAFTTAGGSDPSGAMPGQGDTSGDGASSFWLDVQVRDTPPDGYTGSYRMQPSTVYPDYQSGNDNPQPYNLATQFQLSQASELNDIWFFSPPGATGGLPTECAIWQVTGPNSGVKVAEDTSPAWSGAQASGWVACAFTGVTLPAGDYKVAAYNKNGAGGTWSYKRIGWFGPFGSFRVIAAADVVCGPLTFPVTANADLAYAYNGNPSGTPPYSDGTTQPGQCTFAIGDGTPSAPFPYLYVNDVGAATQYYGLDVEITPVAVPRSGLLLMASYI